jgi:hypothetical protein
MKETIIVIFILLTINSYAQETHDESLNAMNRVKMKEYYELSSTRKGKPFRVLILGNSIARHGRYPEIGWNQEFGMAATKEDNDYVHLVFRKIEGLLPKNKILLREASIVKFEREFPVFDFKTMDQFIQFHPDIIIFQLGENTGFNEVNTPELFQQKYVELINNFKKNNHPVVICTTPFFPDLKKNEVIGQTALLTGSFLVDLSHLPLLDTQNYAKDETNYAGNKSEWKVSGIGIHPGDYGMKNIALQLFITIKAALNVKSK